MPQNLLVVGLDDANLQLLQRLPGSEDIRYHAALEFEELRGVSQFPFEQLLETATQRLDAVEGGVDGVCTFLDFPATELVPLLAAHAGVPGPRLEAVLKCGHKHWSRLVQRAAAPEAVPRFTLLDPFDPASVEALELDLPFWLKPLNAFRSHLGFHIADRQDLEVAIAELRAHLPRLAGPLQQVLAHAEVPDEIADLPVNAVIAEELLTGRLCTVEGYVVDGHPHAYAVVDSVREEGSSSFSRYQYPSALPHEVQATACALAERVVAATGLDESTFNVEIFVDPERGQLGLLEINSRLSQSHAPLFERVDGVSHLKLMVDLALGRRPTLPRRQGPDAVAAKLFLRAHRDAVVERVPAPEVVAEIERRFPGAIVHVLVEAGTRLRDLEDQDAYSYELAEVYLGASSQPELLWRWEECQRLLDFELT
jgi:biotin carboxylase